MLSEEDKRFMQYWETMRVRRNRWAYRFPFNLSTGIVFGALMILFFLVEGQRDKSLVSRTDLVLIVTGAILIAVFYAVIQGNILWEKNEARYTILRLRKEQEDQSTQPPADDQQHPQ